ncbi:hypothetical protein CcaCcLH18_13114 [Colletotrichum camelliae]|nr:hypothetical protein CcaCcLH18_13114 [Colletotrichum camelliae]
MPGKQNHNHAAVSEALPEYSIKPIAYVFPQFHAIPENDKFWGENFTEWVNVQKLTINKYGVEVIRPAKEIGFYNLLDLETRKRWTDTIKKSQLHGLVFHHYWFGYPVMDKVLQAMLNDGHPDVPFMLNWANEPWTVRWDGADQATGTLLAQKYGDIHDWRKHYEWMRPFFIHPNYIRVNGKVQMMVYNPGHIGDLGKRMFEAWRLWASQDPEVGGMDVIETKLESDDPNSRGNTDAINEFGLRSGGGSDCTAWPQNPRSHRTFYRGALVGWDNTPRHATDGGGDALVFNHPKLWKHGMIQVMRRIKTDPNPVGQENFLFINAFNEWGESNTFEPSTRFGDGFLKALNEAKEFSDTHIKWTPHLLLESSKIAQEVNDNNTQVDACVIIRDFHTTYPFQEAWTLAQMVDSLRDLKNKRWRAVVAGVHSDDEKRKIDYTLLNLHEPRIINADVPDDVQQRIEESPDGSNATDWVIKNIDTISPGCGRAKYMLITNATNMYEPDAFDALGTADADIVGMNFESKESMRLDDAAQPANFTWQQRCERFENGMSRTCRASTVDSELLDLGAAFINMKRWRKERVELVQSVRKGGESSILRKLAKQSSPWTWAPPAAGISESCHMLQAGALTTCLRSGRLWVDLPDAGGYSADCVSGAGLRDRYPGPKIPDQFDYARFDQHPFCVRLSQKFYEDAVGSSTESSTPTE